MPEQRPLKVFLCHASADKPAVRKLHRYLRQRGVQPWLDELNLLPGQDWQVEIPNAIYSSDVILVCLSKNSINKEGYVQKEITFALDKAMEKPEGTIFIIPAKLEECDVPQRLSRYQWVDLYREDGRKRLVQSLYLRAKSLGAGVSEVRVFDETSRRLPRSNSTKIKPDKKNEKSVPDTQTEEIYVSESKNDAQETTLNIENNDLIMHSPTGWKEVLPKKEKSARQNDVAQQKPDSLSKSTTSNTSLEGGAESKPKPTRKFDFRKTGLIAVILTVLVLGILGINYAINNWPTTALPTPTPQPATKTVTSTSQPATATVALIPSTSTPTRKPPTPAPTLGIGSTKISEKDGMTMVFVPAGEFTMGSEVGEDDEKPVHTVYLDSYWIDKTEVTNKMYAMCVSAGVCQPPPVWVISYRNYYDLDDYPVYYVNWYQAKTYCTWANRRLPTEAEWEKAARGPNGRAYPWGEQSPNSSLYNDYPASRSTTDNFDDYMAVGSYPTGASFYGALDMAGNVWEWVSSVYLSYPYFAGGDRENLSANLSRTVRGLSWYGDLGLVRSSSRWRSRDPFEETYGFRCALSAK